MYRAMASSMEYMFHIAKAFRPRPPNPDRIYEDDPPEADDGNIHKSNLSQQSPNANFHRRRRASKPVQE